MCLDAEASLKMPQTKVISVGKGHVAFPAESSTKMLQPNVLFVKNPHLVSQVELNPKIPVKRSLREERPLYLPERVWTSHNDVALSNVDSAVRKKEQAAR